MRYGVEVTKGAEADILGIWLYLAENDSLEAADHVLGRLKEVIESLGHAPMRGHVPPELERVGVNEYLQVHFKPYGILYRVSEKRVEVYCVLDGRRDLQSELEKRLLR